MPHMDTGLQIYSGEPVEISGDGDLSICTMYLRVGGVLGTRARICWGAEDHAEIADKFRAALDAMTGALDDDRVAERAAAAELVIARALGEPTVDGAA